jgi:hypothetical protein
MTMAPGQRKRGFWLELLFISVLVFLLIGARSQTAQKHGANVPKLSIGADPHRALFTTPASLK